MILGVFYKEFGVGSWVNWTRYLVNEVQLSQNLESENAGEAGLISIDNVSLEFRMETITGADSPVATALDESSLNSKDRLMFLIRAYPDDQGGYTDLFEGMADLSSIQYPYIKDDSGEYIRLVSFTVIDKLPAMSNLQPLGLRRVLKDAVPTLNSGTVFAGTGSGTISGSIGSNVIIGVGTNFTSEFYEEDDDKCGSKITVDGIGLAGADVDFIVKKIHSDTKLELWQKSDFAFAGITWAYTFESTGANGLYRPRFERVSDNEFTIKFYGSVFDGLIDYADQLNITSNPLEEGDIIAIPSDRKGASIVHASDDYYESQGYADKTIENYFDLYLVKDTYLTGSPGHIYVKTVNSTEVAEDSYALYDYDGDPGHIESCHQYQTLYYYDKLYYGSTFLVSSGGEAQAYDAIELIEALVASIWTGTTLVHAEFTDYEIPLEYFTRLIDYLPFDHHPLEAIKFLVDNINAYLWFEPGNDQLVIKKWDNYATDTATFNLDSYNANFAGGTKRYFWDKLKDAAEIYVSSFLPQRDLETNEWTGQFIDGAGFSYKSQLGKPRNIITKKLIVDDDTLTAYGITFDINGEYWDNVNKINEYGDLKAAEYMDFYGKRHYAFEVEYILDYAMLASTIRMGSVVTFNAEKYFVNRLEIDFASPKISFELVSVTGYDYDITTVLIEKYTDDILSSDNQNITGSPLGGIAVGGGTAGSGISELGVITAGTWNADPITASYILYNPHNLSNDYESIVQNDLQKDATNGNAVLSFGSVHSFRMGATVTLTSVTGITDGDYTIINIPSATSITINTTNGTTSTSGGTVASLSSLNTIQDLGLLDEPQFFGQKISHDRELDYLNYVPNTYVHEIEYVDTNGGTPLDFGYMRLFDTDFASYEYGTFDLLLKDNTTPTPFNDIQLTMNPSDGFDLVQDGSSVRFSETLWSVTTEDNVTTNTRATINQGINYFERLYYDNIDTTPTTVYSSTETFISGIDLRRLYSTSFSPTIELQRRRGDSITPDYLSDDDLVGAIKFSAYGVGTAKTGMYAYTSGTHIATDTPIRLEFFTTPDTTVEALSRFVIDSEGKLGFGVAHDEILTGRDVTFSNAFGIGNPDFVGGWMAGTGWWMEAETFSGSAQTVGGGSSQGQGVYEITTTSAHGMSAGDRVIISGCVTHSALNGGYIVQAVTSTTFDILTTYTTGFASPDGTASPVAYEYNMTVDNLNIRGTLSVWELLVHQIQVTNGNLMVTSAAKTTSALLNDGSDYFSVEDVTERGYAPFVANDIIMCQQVNFGELTNGVGDPYEDNWTFYAVHGALIKRILYKVVSVSGLNVYVTTSGMSFPTSKGIIEPGDGFVRIGNTTDSNRQGFVGIFSDDEYAPYIRIADDIASWADWKSQNSTKVQIGNLEGLSDTVFGGALTNVTGKKYGMYLADNIFMKGNIVVQSDYDNQMTMMTESIMIGNVDHDSPVADSIIITRWDDGVEDLEKSGIFGYGASSNLMFALRLDDTTTPHSISGWSFDHEKLYKDNVRLEATASIDGLVITESTYSQDVVKIGDFTTLEPAPYSISYNAQIDNETFESWTTTVLDDWNIIEYGDATYIKDIGEYSEGSTSVQIEASSYTGTENFSVVFRQVLADITSIKGKELTITFDWRTESGANANQMWVTVMIEQREGADPYSATRKTYNYDETATEDTWYEGSLSAQITSNASNVAIRITVGYASDTSTTVKAFNIDNVNISEYPIVHTHINGDGFYIKSSPANYIKFDGTLDIGASNIYLNGSPPCRWLGSVDTSDVSSLTTYSGDIANIIDGADQTIEMYIRGWGWLELYNVATGTITTLGDLTDVSVGGVTDGKFLQYQSGSGLWTDEALIQSMIGGLTTTDTPTFTGLLLSGLTASRLLVSDASKNITASSVTSTEAGYLSGVTSAIQTQLDTHTHTLADLSDTNIASLSVGHIISWTGSEWQNAALSVSIGMDDLTDATITSVASGEVLKWSGSAWINNTLTEAGILGLVGGTLTGDLVIADDDGLFFGDGFDTGIHYYPISDTIVWNSVDAVVSWKLSFNGETSILANADGAVELYYNNVVKLATSNAGGTLTGTWNATTSLTVGGTPVVDTPGTLLDKSGTTLNVDLSELSTSVLNGDGDYFCVVNTLGGQSKLTKANINLSGFNDDLTNYYESGDSPTFADITVTTRIDLGDDIELRFGATADVELYYINATDKFVFNFKECDVEFLSQQSELAIRLDNSSGTVALYFGQSIQKLITSSTGVTITGELELTGNLDISGTDMDIYTGATQIGELTTAGKLSVKDDLVGFATFSDIKLKENIVSVKNGYKNLMSLKPVGFNWNDKVYKEKRGLEDFGFIAQDVEKLYPTVILNNAMIGMDKEYKGIRYEKMLPFVVAGIQEGFTKHELEINKLKKEVRKLKNKLANKRIK